MNPVAVELRLPHDEVAGRFQVAEELGVLVGQVVAVHPVDIGAEFVDGCADQPPLARDGKSANEPSMNV